MMLLAGWSLVLLEAQAGLAITHSGVNCLVAERFPVLEARFEPAAEVARARAYFRKRGTVAWYSVEMASQGPGHRAVLPAPQRGTEGVDYYIEVVGQRFASSRTDQHSPDVVRGTCDRRLAAPFLASARVLVTSPPGAPPLPPGFSGQGLVAASGAGGAGAGAAAGGLGAKALIVGGVLAAGATAGVVAATGGSGDSGVSAAERDDDGDGVSEAQGDCNDSDRSVRPDGGFVYRAELPWRGDLDCARPPQGTERHFVKNNSCTPLTIRRFTVLHAVEPIVCFGNSGPVTVDMTPGAGPVPPGVEVPVGTTPTRAHVSCCQLRSCAEWGASRLPYGGTCRHKFLWTLETSAGTQSLEQAWNYDVLDCPICP